MWIKIVLLTALALLLIAAGLGFTFREQIGAYPDSQDMAHYAHYPFVKDGQFQSRRPILFNPDQATGGKVSLWRFLFTSPYAPATPLPYVALNRASFPTVPGDYAFYWLGHSSAILELAGKRLLIDPVFDNAAPVPLMARRHGPPPLSREALPTLDYILITHGHYDHLERATVRHLRDHKFIVPLGLGTTLSGWGVDPNNITELGWGERFNDGPLTVIAEEAVHYSQRGRHDRNRTLWVSYVIQTPNRNLFWSGDSGYGDHFRRIGEQYGPFDWAALEIDGWNPGWANSHLFPDQAVTAAMDLRAKVFLPIHWGVFDLAFHPWRESIDAVTALADDHNIPLLTPLMGERIEADSTTRRWWRDLPP